MTATAVAASIVSSAVTEARAINASVVGQEHVLLAVGTQPSSLAARLLAQLGIDAGVARGNLLAMIAPAPKRDADPEPTVRLVRAIQEAEEEAAAAGRATTSADLVVGIMRTHQGVGYMLLAGQGVTLDRARASLADLVPGDEELSDTCADALVEVLSRR